MKAIVLHQPWASLWLATPRIKLHETRSFRTSFVGERFAVIAGKQRPDDIGLAFKDFCISTLRRHPMSLPRGCVLGLITVGEVRSTDGDLSDIHRRDLTCGDWSPGRWAWRGDDPVLFQQFVPWRGQQGVWSLPDNTFEHVR